MFLQEIQNRIEWEFADLEYIQLIITKRRTQMKLSVLAATVDGRWQPGIGDPTVIGWLTVAAYFFAVVCCFIVWRLNVKKGIHDLFWPALTLLLVFLGINKQLDLQTLLTQIARDFLKSQGEYAHRRPLQVAFIAGVALVCLITITVCFYFIRKNLDVIWPALLGIILLLGFVVIRAASFHHVDAFLAARIGGMKWNWIFELGGIALITTGALRAASKLQSSGKNDPQK